MNEKTQRAIAATGDLGEKVKDHLINTLALVDELESALQTAQANADDSLEAGQRDEFNLATNQVHYLYTLIMAVQNSGR